MPVLSSVMRLVASLTLTVGEKVAVQVMPPSLLLTALNVPLAMVRSALEKPLTASLNVMVTNEVWPSASVVSATTMVAVGRTVSMAKLFESVVPLPTLPEPFCTPLLSSVIRLVASVMVVVGVNVAVQVMPPSLLLTALSVPFAMVRSALLKPVTASEKVMVTSEVSPILSALSATTKAADGLGEGDGHQRGFARGQGGIGQHNRGRRTHRVDGVVVGIGSAAAGVARQIRDAG